VIDVCLTRTELRPADVAVVIDVLRATSTATQALASGYETVLFAQTLELAAELRGAGRVLAGERHCVKPPGFDQGNSPREAALRCGTELVLATTNGAPTIVSAAVRTETVLLACMLNLRAVAEELSRLDPDEHDVAIVCSGTNGAMALEDVYVAGRLSASLPGPRSDAALAAEAVARAFATPLDALSASANAAVLVAAGLGADVAYCARESELDVTPRVLAASVGVALVGAGAPAARPVNSPAAPPAISATRRATLEPSAQRR
jgi:2-phosphosulfolactate phosphatase